MFFKHKRNVKGDTQLFKIYENEQLFKKLIYQLALPVIRNLENLAD